MKFDGKIPTLNVKADSIPEAYYEALKKVYEEGYELRTQYDRKDTSGDYIDPPGKDAKIMIEVTDPFAEPRFPILSYCERGKYIAEFLGVKDHLVVPYGKLLKMVRSGGEFEPTIWPYCYHQRLTAYPCSDGSTIDQIDVITDMLARDPLTRRAVAITGVPEIDLFLKSDQPCLREIQLRAIEDEQGRLMVNTHARWRSRDSFKAWGDNLIGITNLVKREVVPKLEEKTGKEVLIGPYSEENGSLHTYGQDYTEGAMSMSKFFEVFPTRESFVGRAWTSEMVRDVEILPQLQELKEESIWRFPAGAIKLLDDLIEDLEQGRYLP